LLSARRHIETPEVRRRRSYGRGFYMQARWYDPGSGRFLSVDPLIRTTLIPQSANPYSYTENNPVNGVDPTGEQLYIFTATDPATGDVYAWTQDIGGGSGGAEIGGGATGGVGASAASAGSSLSGLSSVASAPSSTPSAGSASQSPANAGNQPTQDQNDDSRSDDAMPSEEQQKAIDDLFLDILRADRDISRADDKEADATIARNTALKEFDNATRGVINPSKARSAMNRASAANDRIESARAERSAAIIRRSRAEAGLRSRGYNPDTFSRDNSPR